MLVHIVGEWREREVSGRLDELAWSLITLDLSTREVWELLGGIAPLPRDEGGGLGRAWAGAAGACGAGADGAAAGVCGAVWTWTLIGAPGTGAVVVCVGAAAGGAGGVVVVSLTCWPPSGARLRTRRSGLR